MGEALDSLWGNPSSVHGPGRRARAAVEDARREVARLIGGSADGLVFTSGGTEADNLALFGLVRAATRAGRRGRVLSTRIEHPAVLAALATLAREGVEVRFVAVDGQGRIDREDYTRALGEGETTLVSVALANHEIGVLAEVGALCSEAHARGALFHTDAVQAVGRLPVDVAALGVDALSLSGHKLHGPKGVGALWLRPGLLPEPVVTGGRQERERRAGTENVPGIVGLGAAALVARAALAAGRAGALATLRDRLEARLLATIAGARRHGPAEGRVPGTSNLGFADAPGQLVVIGLDLEGVAVSSGAACSSGTPEPSAVLLALGLPPAAAREAVRFSLGGENTSEEVDRVAALTATVVARVRAAGG